MRFRSEPPHKLPAIPGLLQATRTENELSLDRGQSQRADRARPSRILGAEAVDELPISLEDALIAHVGRQGDRSFFLNTIGDGTMKALILKEWREHLKWVPLPGLVILLVFSIEKPEEPMP